MNGVFYIGATALSANERAIDVTANNITNINSPAYKRSTVQFSDLIAVPVDENSEPIALSTRIPLLSGTTIAATPRVWDQGDLRQTDRSLDFAIDGQGFVELQGPSGRTYLWRGGTLKVDQDGFLATNDGMVLSARISVPDDATGLIIANDGTVSVNRADSTEAEEVGRIDLILARDLDSLVDVGAGRYEASDPTLLTNAMPGEGAAGILRQGALEQSNVNLADEMVNLLLVQRAYGAAAQVVQAGDQMMSIANNLRR